MDGRDKKNLNDTISYHQFCKTSIKGGGESSARLLFLWIIEEGVLVWVGASGLCLIPENR